MAVLTQGGSPVALVPQNGGGALAIGVINKTTTGSSALVSSASGRITRIYALLLSAPSALQFTLFNGTSSAVSGSIALGAGSNFLLPYTGYPWFELSSGASFTSTASSTSGIFGMVWYRQDPDLTF
jgi:hypothetical protein